MPLHPPLYVPPPEDTPIPGSCSGQTLVLQNPRDSPQPPACRPARCQNQGPNTCLVLVKNRHTYSSTQILGETGSVAVMKNRIHQNDFGDHGLKVSPWLTAILAVLSQPGDEYGQPPVRSSIQRKMEGAGHQQGVSLTLILTLIPCLGSLCFQGLLPAWSRVSSEGRVGGELGGRPQGSSLYNWSQLNLPKTRSSVSWATDSVGLKDRERGKETERAMSLISCSVNLDKVCILFLD